MDNKKINEKYLMYDKEGDLFYWSGSFYTREIPKRAGFLFDKGKTNRWITHDITNAQKLLEYGNIDAVRAYNQKVSHIEMSISPIYKGFEIPKPNGLEYLEYQKVGIHLCCKLGNAILGDEMGLGKTIQAIGVINAMNANKILIVCPASLRLNWKMELEKWLITEKRIYIFNGTKNLPWNSDFFNIFIVNYDIVSSERIYSFLVSMKYDLAISDESHYMVNIKTKRTKYLLGINNHKEKIHGILRQAERNLFLTGTPILNRPIELWPIINFINPKKWNNRYKFGQEFCNAKYNGFGWDYNGSSNLEKLGTELRATTLIRRLKADVLKDLPPKFRQIIPIIPDNSDEAKKIAKEYEMFEAQQKTIRIIKNNMLWFDVIEDQESYKKEVKKLFIVLQIHFSEFARMRRELAVMKAPKACEYIKGVLENVNKVIIFAHHHEVVDIAMNYFKNFMPVKITGKDSMEKRNDAVNKFQNDEKCRVFIGNIKAAGVGITLTASNYVVFIEQSWVPSELAQAEDRAHRIGQKDNVLIQHVVYERSLDIKMMTTIIQKQEVIDKTLDTVDIEKLKEIETGNYDAEMSNALMMEEENRNQYLYEKVIDSDKLVIYNEEINKEIKSLIVYMHDKKLWNEEDKWIGKKLYDNVSSISTKYINAAKIMLSLYKETSLAGKFDRIFNR